jgi:phage minor structural protein
MDLIAVYDHITGKRLCFLENAYDISYELKLNGLGSASFSLPADDCKNVYCKPLNYVEIWDNGERAELFRILPTKFTKSAGQKDISYDCEHVLATLLDDVLFGAHSVGNTGTYTSEVINYVLDRQSVKRWSLADCDFNHQYLYTWENENLLSALFSIANCFVEPYIWTFDTREINNFKLSLKLRDTSSQKGEIRYGKNLDSITKTIDPTNLCTRLYPLGYGEGDNQLNICPVNGGLPYLDADTAAKYGIVAKIAVDRRYQYAESLLEYGKSLLEQTKEPYLSYSVDMSVLNGERISPGDIVRIIDDEDGISALLPVTAVKKENSKVKVTIANKEQDIAQSMADLSDRQRIADLYSQGSVNIDSTTFADNADSSNPAVLRFYISDKVVRINSVNLTYKLTSFRAYSKAAASGGGSTYTSSSGGGGATTSSSGGGGTRTSSSGGQQLISNLKVEASDGAISTKYADGTGSHRHALPAFGFTMPNISIPSHTHTVEINDHTHSVNIPSHTHSVTIPSHTHDIVYGIYTGSSATSASIKVDGKTIPAMPQNGNADIAKYLSTDSSGRIQRGTWHEVQIIPNGLTRVEASLQSIVFINPKGGGDL